MLSDSFSTSSARDESIAAIGDYRVSMPVRRLDTRSGEIKFPPICWTDSTAVSSPRYVTSTASSAWMMGCTGPAAVPRPISPKISKMGSFPIRCSVNHNRFNRAAVLAMHAVVTKLYSFRPIHVTANDNASQKDGDFKASASHLEWYVT